MITECKFLDPRNNIGIFQKLRFSALATTRTAESLTSTFVSQRSKLDGFAITCQLWIGGEAIKAAAAKGTEPQANGQQVHQNIDNIDPAAGFRDPHGDDILDRPDYFLSE